MPIFRHSFLILVAATVFECMMPRHVMAESIQVTEMEVYAAFINYFAKDIDPNKSLLIESTTALLHKGFGNDVESGIKTLIPEASATVVADLKRVSVSSVSLSIPQRLVRQEIQYAIFEERLLSEIFKSDSLAKNWNRFYSTYPTATGIFAFLALGLMLRINKPSSTLNTLAEVYAVLGSWFYSS